MVLTRGLTPLHGPSLDEAILPDGRRVRRQGQQVAWFVNSAWEWMSSSALPPNVDAFSLRLLSLLVALDCIEEQSYNETPHQVVQEHLDRDAASS